MPEALLKLETCAERMQRSVRALRNDIEGGQFGPRLIRIGAAGRSVRVLEGEFSAWLQAGCPIREQWEQQQRAETARTIHANLNVRRQRAAAG